MTKMAAVSIYGKNLKNFFRTGGLIALKLVIQNLRV